MQVRGQIESEVGAVSNEESQVGHHTGQGWA